MAANPMLQMLNQSRPSISNNPMAMLQGGMNPQQLINNLMARNPQISNLINQYGHGDPKAAFYEYARLKGANPDEILNMIRGMM